MASKTVAEGYKAMIGRINAEAKAKELMAGWEKVVQFVITDEGDFFIHFANGQASFNEGKHESPDVTLTGPQDVFAKMLSRELDPTTAFFAQKYTVQGSMGDAMKFVRIGNTIAKS
jgi:putative sterol carrier protein